MNSWVKISYILIFGKIFPRLKKNVYAAAVLRIQKIYMCLQLDIIYYCAIYVK